MEKKPEEQVQAKDFAEDVPVIMDDRFELQALVWSTIPEERMVVIDGRIMNVGDVTEDLKIKGIREKYVIIETGGELWKIRFGVR